MKPETMPAGAAIWLVDEMIARGIGLADILASTGLDESWYRREDAEITVAQYCRIVENSLDESGDPGIGLSASGQPNYISRLGYWGYAVISANDFGAANRTAMEYWEVSGSLAKCSFRREGDIAAWEVLPASPLVTGRVAIFAIEKMLAAACGTVEFVTGSPPPMIDLELAYEAPLHAHLYRAVFGCDVRFGGERNTVRMHASVLDRPLRMSSVQIAETCERQCRALLRKHRRSDQLVHLIRRMIVASPGRFPAAEEVAGELGVSARTLSRRLLERGTTYKAILDEVRLELALGYLQSTRLSIDQIAALLGYAETTNFRRAFKKWNGQSAASVRRTGGTGL